MSNMPKLAKIDSGEQKPKKDRKDRSMGKPSNFGI